MNTFLTSSELPDNTVTDITSEEFTTAFNERLEEIFSIEKV